MKKFLVEYYKDKDIFECEVLDENEFYTLIQKSGTNSLPESKSKFTVSTIGDCIIDFT